MNLHGLLGDALAVSGGILLGALLAPLLRWM